MKNIKYFAILLIALVSYSSCNKCEDIVLKPSCDVVPNSEHCGWTVATCYSENPFSPVGVIYETQYNSSAPRGDDWGTTGGTQVIDNHPVDWTPNDIGQVFGITIDKNENIYLASSDIYIYGYPIASSNLNRPYPCGQVFKCAPPTWNAVPLFDVPNSCDPLNGTGNIAYDKVNNQLFVSNLEDGKIYCRDVNGNPKGDYDPWLADIPSAKITIQSERVWGLNINYENGDVKVYFSRVVIGSPTSPLIPERSIYSITLSNGAFPIPGSEVLEVSNIPGTQDIISDIAFSSDGLEMLVAERGHPHDSRVISYTKSGNTWNFNKTYFVGGGAGLNSAGGVDFAYTEKDGNLSDECDEYFWATGNFMAARNSSLGLLYGMQGINYTGNNSSSALTPTANQDTDLFIDFDGIGGTTFKGTIGDVEVFDCTECSDDPCNLNASTQ